MFKKLFLLILFFSISIFANELKTVDTDKFQLVAKDLDNGTYRILAKGNVFITTPKYYILADELVYYKESKIAEAYGNVVLIQNGTSQLMSEYVYFDFKNNKKIFNPALFLDSESKLWVNSENIDGNKKEYDFGLSTISSCDCVDPAWSFRVSSATHDNEDQWMQVYNMRLYIGDIPIFYLPYFAYPTDNTRRTGLLTPTIGVVQNEGLLYAQPIYFAPADDWDLELTPQIRTKRGKGLYSTYRYADSINSTLLFNTGIFKENEDYYKRYSLENESHYGFNLDYERINIFEGENSNDGLSVWLEGMNDIDYRNLDNNNISATGTVTSYGTKRENYLNYYYDMSRFYNGVYFKYYLDTSSSSTNDTLQQLPQYQSHLYTDSLFFDKLLYSTDLIYSNYYREDGITANKTDLNIPLSYEFSFFDDYLFLKLKEDTTFSNIHYANEEDFTFNDGDYIKSSHQVSLSTDLIKPYRDIAHSINLGIEYSVPKIYQESGDLYGITNDDDLISDFSYTKDKKSLSISAKNYFYDIKSKNLLLSDFLTQSYEHKNGGYVATNLENAISINFTLSSISNRIIFNQEDDEFILSSTSYSFDNEVLDLDVSHYKTRSSENTSYDDTESMTFSASVDFSKKYSISYSNSYDIMNKESSKEIYSIKYEESCWSLELELQDSLVTSSSTTSPAIRQDIYYLTFELKPLGGYTYTREMDQREE